MVRLHYRNHLNIAQLKKDIYVVYHLSRHYFQNGTVKFSSTPSVSMVAVSMTNPLGRAKLCRNSIMLGLHVNNYS